MFDRLISLIGEEKFNALSQKNILIIGIGGVGGYALEALVRSGVKNITIIDYDVIDISNINRQIIANSNNVGEEKIDVAIKRMKEINPSINIKGIDIKLNENNLGLVLNGNFDYIIDACDTTNVKFELMKRRDELGYNLISCMGTAKKMNPELLEITTLDKTEYDPLAKKLRHMLRKENIKGKFYVVSSKESVKTNENLLGSLITVTAIAGFYLASFIINDCNQ